jgi:hypothetical protein
MSFTASKPRSDYGQDWITFVCLSTLTNGLSLLDRDTSPHQKLWQVANGHYDLLQYSTEFWAQHLIDSSAHQLLGPNSRAVLALEKFESLHTHHCHQLERDMPAPEIGGGKDHRLESLLHIPGISICASYDSFQAQYRSQSAQKEAGKYYTSSEANAALSCPYCCQSYPHEILLRLKRTRYLKE